MATVLIVDDEPIIVKALTKLMEQMEGVEAVITASNGEEAIMRLTESRPHIVFTDIRMPKLDGLALCRYMAEHAPNVQVAVISGYGDFEYAQQCMSYGVKEYLLKPVNRQKVQQALGKLMKLSVEASSVPYVSLAELEQRLDRLEACIWSLQREEAERQLAEWCEQLERQKLPAASLAKLLTECMEWLLRKLGAKEFRPAPDLGQLNGAAATDELFERFSELVLGLLSELQWKRKGKWRDPVEEAKQYVDEHVGREVSLEEVAQLLGLNPSYFSQLFKQTTGETFVQYRIKRKMERAKVLLQQPHYRITDISYEVGYADHPHFTKTFKKVTGYSPSEYRQMLGIES